MLCDWSIILLSNDCFVHPSVSVLSPHWTPELSPQTNTKNMSIFSSLANNNFSLMSAVSFSDPLTVVRRYPVFLGRPHRTWLRQEPLHIQRILQVNRTLYIGARYKICQHTHTNTHIHFETELHIQIKLYRDVSELCNMSDFLHLLNILHKYRSVFSKFHLISKPHLLNDMVTKSPQKSTLVSKRH